VKSLSVADRHLPAGVISLERHHPARRMLRYDSRMPQKMWFDLNHGGFPPDNMARLPSLLFQALLYANECSCWILGLWREVRWQRTDARLPNQKGKGLPVFHSPAALVPFDVSPSRVIVLDDATV